jgi:hypothetical protein
VRELIDEEAPAVMSVGKTNPRAGDVFNRPLRLPCREPMVALRAHVSKCVVVRVSAGVDSNATIRPRPTIRGAASSFEIISRGK